MLNAALGTQTLPESSSPALAKIARLDRELTRQFADKLVIQNSLSRSLVSFQANKTKAVHRWYKYKEAFSAPLIEYLFQKYQVSGNILDPFAGSGTALFVASELGNTAAGIELLPIGQQIIHTKKLLEADFTASDIARLQSWHIDRPWQQFLEKVTLPELRITKGAYSEATHEGIEKYLAALQHENERVQTVLRFALLCVLEAISFTRKDGQYLRWDYRSARTQGKRPFDKGFIPSFEQAMCAKLEEIIFDLNQTDYQDGLFPIEKAQGEIHLHEGSCLELLPEFAEETYDCVVTSPPYCNRYDYTRTYALELALLGIDEKGLVALRQEMLSCTVENRAKDLLAITPAWETAIAVTDNQELLQTILKYLDDQKESGALNNNGIPRMVRGYFYEMACVIAECARVMKSGAPLLMVNDNVRYAGASISVDLILSSLAEQLGFAIETILVLPNGKGNSSQQMGEHGRDPLRKCVYVWRKI